MSRKNKGKLSVVIVVLFLQACFTNNSFIAFTEFLSAAGALVIFLSLGITGFAGFIDVFCNLIKVITEKTTANIAIDKFTVFPFCFSASGAKALLFPFEVEYSSFFRCCWHKVSFVINNTLIFIFMECVVRIL